MSAMIIFVMGDLWKVDGDNAGHIFLHSKEIGFDHRLWCGHLEVIVIFMEENYNDNNGGQIRQICMMKITMIMRPVW